MPSIPVLFDPSRIAIQPHPCPKCSGPMVLTFIKPSRIGFERRMFQGVNCDHVDKIVTETHSMKWMCSRLRAPH
jgi:ssDNA-binding Zn-finger/Zn-ribbon topoisomerase 1